MASSSPVRLARLATRAIAVAALVALAVVVAACGSGSSSSNGASGGGPSKTLGILVGAKTPDWMVYQGKVAEALAKRKGWKTVTLNNNLDGPTALKNADILIQKKVDYVVMFQADASVNPVLSKKFKAKGIPVVTYDIAGPGMYFLGIDNFAAGRLGGRRLGEYAKQHWNCQPDLVMLGIAALAGDANTQRVNGNLAGIRDICPNIPDSKIVKWETHGEVNYGAKTARDVLSSHPSARKIIVGGLNDAAVVGALQAADQLHRGGQIVAWGQDGSLITGKNSDPRLLGSVLYFLEGYPVYAFNDILDKLAAGKQVPVGDSVKDPTVKVDPCPVTRAQAQKIPDTAERVKRLLAAPTGTTEAKLFCPVKPGL